MKNTGKSTDSSATGHIIMATRNGAPYLREQLTSIRAQSCRDWMLWVRDDGSDDNTRAILERFQDQNPGQVSLRWGARLGASRNFLTLLSVVPETANWLAFCDQDDVWFNSKLEDGKSWLARQGQTPALYVARSWISDPELSNRYLGPIHKKYGFSNALVENVAPGHALMLNGTALRLLQNGLPFAWNVFAFDWWSYALISAAGGTVHLDEKPGQIYRQHANNEIGVGNKLRALRAISSGEYSARITTILDALAPMRAQFTPENRRRFDRFCHARKARSAVRRIAGIRAAGLRRNSGLAQAMLHLCAGVRLV